MAKVVADSRAHLPQYAVYCGLTQCSPVCNQRYANAVHELKKRDHNLFLYTYRLPPMRRLSLYVWPEVVNQTVERCTPHTQYVVKHIGRIDFKQVLLEPASGPGLDIPSCRFNAYVAGKKVKNFLSRCVVGCAPIR